MWCSSTRLRQALEEQLRTSAQSSRAVAAVATQSSPLPPASVPVQQLGPVATDVDVSDDSESSLSPFSQQLVIEFDDLNRHMRAHRQKGVLLPALSSSPLTGAVVGSPFADKPPRGVYTSPAAPSSLQRPLPAASPEPTAVAVTPIDALKLELQKQLDGIRLGGPVSSVSSKAAGAGSDAPHPALNDSSDRVLQLLRVGVVVDPPPPFGSAPLSPICPLLPYPSLHSALLCSGMVSRAHCCPPCMVGW